MSFVNPAILQLLASVGVDLTNQTVFDLQSGK